MKNSIIGKLQFLISALAVLAIAFFSLTPLISVEVESNGDIYATSFDTVLAASAFKEYEALEKNDSLTEEEREEKEKKLLERYDDIASAICGVNEEGEKVETKISVSFIDLIKSFTDAVKFGQYYMIALSADALKDAGEDCTEDLNTLQEKIDPEAVNAEAIALFRLVFNDVISYFDLNSLFSDAESAEAAESAAADMGFKLIASVFLTAIKVGVLCSLLVIFPVAMLLMCIGLLLGLISHKRYVKTLKKCKKAVIWISTLLIALIICDAQITGYGKLMIGAACIAVAINLVASMFKSYTSKERKFLCVMQLTALISVAGAVIFAVFIARADIVHLYISSEFLTEAMSSMTNQEEATKAILIFAGMAFLALIVLLSVIKCALKLVMRASCMGAGGGSGFFTALIGIAFVLANGYVTDEYGISLTSAQSDALEMAFIGAAVIAVSAIAFKILRPIVTGKMTREERRAVMNGAPLGDSDGE